MYLAADTGSCATHKPILDKTLGSVMSMWRLSDISSVNQCTYPVQTSSESHAFMLSGLAPLQMVLSPSTFSRRMSSP